MTDTISTLAQKLRPHWLRDLGNGSGGIIAAGGGGMTVHTLSGSYHTGELDPSQATWAVTDAELVAHTGNPDAHHPRVHVLATGTALGPDHTISGATAGHVLRATSATAARFMQLSHGDLGGVTADQHHAQVHNITGSDHTITGSQFQVVGATGANTLGLLTPSSNPGATSAILRTNAGALTLNQLTISAAGYLYLDGTLDFGTNTIYEDASYLQMTGSKAVRFGQNIGNANWTIYNAGGATFSGNVELTGNSDLSVAGSGFYAGNPVLFADSSGGNVGILCNPDPQFALDVNGPARAQYFIGPHAIQLKDALLIAHYDGPDPSSVVGEPNGHFGQVATVAGGVVFRPGKFNKAAQVAPAGQNDVGNSRPNPSGSTTGWHGHAYDMSGSLSPASVTAANAPFVGSKAIGVTYSFSLASVVDFTARAGTYTLTAWVRVVGRSDATISLGMGWGGTGGSIDYIWTPTTLAGAVDGQWYQLRFTAPSTTVAATRGVVVKALVPTSGSYRLEVANVQAELSSFPTPYMDGDMGDGYAWAGTAYASASTRTVGSLSYTGLPVQWRALTMMAWVRLETTAAAAGSALAIGEIRIDNVNRYVLYFDNTNDRLRAFLVASGTSATLTSSTAAAAQTWHHVAVTVNGTAAALFLNGAQVASGTLANAPAGLATAYVGTTGLVTPLNGMVDDFALINRALTAMEVRAVYESDAPVFAESSVWGFRATAKGLVWADDEGLWMKDVSGNPVLGIYGGEAATKSWDGFTLAVGDVVIGRNAVGAAALLWDQSTGKFGWYGNGNGTPYTEIGTDGSITAVNATLSGSITAGAGSIGGWTITSSQINSTNIALYSGANSRLEVGTGAAGSTAGVAAGSSASDVTLWAGQTYANRASAVFRVSLGGALTATSADVTGAIKATSGYIGGTSSGWAIAANQITSNGIGIYAGAAGTARVEVGSGSNIAGLVSGSVAGDVVMWAGSTYTNRANVATPFRVQANGAVYTKAATMEDVSIINGIITSLYAGASAVRLATDGQRFVLPNITSIDVPTSSSALRWFPTIDGTHDATKNYTGLVGYRHTTYNTVDMLYTAYVGSTDAATYAARFILQAGHYDGATYTDTRLEVVREAGSGGKFITAYCDTLTASAALYVTGNCSALSFTDRTPHFDGDGLAALRGVRGKRGKIDHSTLPDFARRQVTRQDGKTEDGRDLGAMISILVAAVGQLEGRIAALEGRTN